MVRHRQVAIVVSATLIATLAACAPVASVPTSAPSADPTSTSSPTAVAAVEPLATVPLECADLFGAEVATEIVSAPVSVKVDESTVVSLDDIAQRQAGLLRCLWGGEARTDNSWDDSLEVAILADADAAFDVGVWQVDDGAIVYPAGSTTSEYRCYQVLENYASCFANVLVNGYWARAMVTNRGGEVGFTPEVAAATMRSIVDSLTSALQAAGTARPAWTPPANPLTGAICGSLVSGVPDESLPYPDAVAQGRTPRAACTVAGASGLEYSVNVVPGGGWALPTIVDRLESPWWEVGPLSVVQITGVESAAGACLAVCSVILELESSAVSVTGTAPGWESGEMAPYLDAFIADVTDLVPQIVAAG